MDNCDYKQLDERYWQMIPNALINDIRRKRLKPSDIAVYAVLRNHLGNHDFVWCSNETVAEYIGCSDRTVLRSIKRLGEAGHIERVTNEEGQTARTYFPKKAAQTPVLNEHTKPEKPSESKEAKPKKLSIEVWDADDEWRKLYEG
jgi:DNA-binding MarR family transcriptional regulator